MMGEYSASIELEKLKIYVFVVGISDLNENLCFELD